MVRKYLVIFLHFYLFSCLSPQNVLKLLVLNIFKNFVKMAGLGAEGVPISMRSLLLT